MVAISAFRVTQHSQIFSLFSRNLIQCIALYQLHNSQALLCLRRGYYSCIQQFKNDNFKRIRKVKKFIETENCDENELIPKLTNGIGIIPDYVPVIIESDDMEPTKY